MAGRQRRRWAPVRGPGPIDSSRRRRRRHSTLTRLPRHGRRSHGARPPRPATGDRGGSPPVEEDRLAIVAARDDELRLIPQEIAAERRHRRALREGSALRRENQPNFSSAHAALTAHVYDLSSSLFTGTTHSFCDLAPSRATTPAS